MKAPGCLGLSAPTAGCQVRGPATGALTQLDEASRERVEAILRGALTAL
jgi:hypothetical protein